MATAPKQSKNPRTESQAERDRKLRERIALEYAIAEAVSSEEHVKFLDAVFKWVRTGTVKGEKPDLKVVEQ